ncbi:MAG: 2OG-Fe(II) oxygenase [Rhodobacteraceae bacterium]|jgi:PKHD-type hydroxylase|nr:2OG-Fe(II) oxygenase [Paracoccaceae bacterium]
MTPFHTIPAALTAEECRAAVALAQTHGLRAGRLVGQVASDLRRAELAWVDDLPDGAWIMDRMVRVVADANRQGFDFALDDFAESAQIARYDAERQGHFDWHSDIGDGALASRRKLTIVVQLSDPAAYAGGLLEMRPDSNIRTAPATLGSATVFPSFVLHRVTPVTQGTRWSLTLWAHGPAFR